VVSQLRNQQNRQCYSSTASRANWQQRRLRAARPRIIMVVQKATVQPVSKYGLPIEAASLASSSVCSVVRSSCSSGPKRGSRLRFRDEIARVAGASVVASLEAPGCATASAWRDLLEGSRRATDEWPSA